MTEARIEQMQGVRVLITGGLGFIGSNLAHRLVSLGAEVTLYDACLEPYGWNFANIEGIADRVKVVKGDVRDYPLLAEQVREQDVVFHLAAQVGREISMENPALDVDINCHGTLNVARACAEASRRVKVVYAGSRGQIGEPLYLPVDEEHPTNPTDVYGINKLAAEKYLLLFGKVYGFPVVSLRLNNVYGPRCQMHHGFYGILNWFIKRAMTGEPITVYGDGGQTRDYVYIDDVVDAFILAAQRPEADGEVFFVGSGVETVFLDMVKEVLRAVGKGSYVHVPFPPSREKIDIKRFVVTYDKLHRLTGWEPRTPLSEGVAKTVEFYRGRLPLYLRRAA
ncbi:MAG: NAD-dependent epimerase/dehydratase family protein [candidate division KSB1 bacterium]|nr:NAD-dependent epimerase/dehydratase family protein [candidate division KSB1 bacterium]MDZ7384766.1 NAD-dependent epimerase/dehydratase family protein [candidate division KSB1 bacterium]MDZ7393553.1 NAD-dependent epimerase/dehydratase family protein [candidate division KSB1 bacterium]MDZ7411994.1 NAD-dependent epimerase/dehydratase family protein [candidate division KSB1 bacterium]